MKNKNLIIVAALLFAGSAEVALASRPSYAQKSIPKTRQQMAREKELAESNATQSHQDIASYKITPAEIAARETHKENVIPENWENNSDQSLIARADHAIRASQQSPALDLNFNQTLSPEAIKIQKPIIITSSNKSQIIINNPEVMTIQDKKVLTDFDATLTNNKNNTTTYYLHNEYDILKTDGSVTIDQNGNITESSAPQSSLYNKPKPDIKLNWQPSKLSQPKNIDSTESFASPGAHLPETKSPTELLRLNKDQLKQESSAALTSFLKSPNLADFKNYVSTTFSILSIRGSLTGKAIKSAVMSIFRSTNSEIPIDQQNAMAHSAAKNLPKDKNNQSAMAQWISGVSEMVTQTLYRSKNQKDTQEFSEKNFDYNDNPIDSNYPATPDEIRL